jgi:hypothetical protein
MILQERQDQYYVDEMERLIEELLQRIACSIEKESSSVKESPSGEEEFALDITDKIIDQSVEMEAVYRQDLEKELKEAKIPHALIREILNYSPNYDLKRDDIQEKIDDQLRDICNTEIQKRFSLSSRIKLEIAARLEDATRTLKGWKPPPDEAVLINALRHRMEKNLIEGRLINETWRRLMDLKNLRNQYLLCEREIAGYQKEIASIEQKLERIDRNGNPSWNKVYHVLTGESEEMRCTLQEEREQVQARLEVCKEDRVAIKVQVGEIAGEDRKSSVIKTLDYLIDVEKQNLAQGKGKSSKVKNKRPQKQQFPPS